ncbi:hypothetical protein DICA3_F27512 [Diutina catenulata]
MRKIWSSRKDRDKRKSMGSGAGYAATVSLAASADDASHPRDLAGAPATPQVDHIARLVRPEWDSTPVKHQWLNVAPGAHAGDLDAAARTYRAELRGSHLYLYKTSQFKRFSVDDPPMTPMTPKTDKFDDAASAQASTQASTSASTQAPSSTAPSAFGYGSYAASSTGTLVSGGSLYGGRNHSTATLDEDPLASAATGPPTVTYFQTSRHPDLNYNADTGKFGPSPVDSLVHFMLFAGADDAKAVSSVVAILPLFPQFEVVVRLVSDYLQAIADGKLGTVERHPVVDRVLQLVNHLESNFMGFLLKQDTASAILKCLEVAPGFVDDPQLVARLHGFKSKMLTKQQSLMELLQGPPPVSNSVLGVPSAELNPFVELNSAMFMKGNLFELAHAVSAIDQRYFRQWNSNIDKSLLLLSSLSSVVPGGNFYKKNPLLFNNDVHIHYLARLLVHHLFVETSSTLERKARLLEKWIDLGCLLDKSGNMSSWLGISSVILSQPVLRLLNVWSLVSADYIKLLKNDWCPVLFELDRRHLATERKDDDDGLARDSYHIMAPRGLGKIYAKETVIPYFGDLVINNDGDPVVDELQAVWKRVNYSFNRWNEYLANLVNYTDIIHYNQDVLQRYDSMGFIFSNESLNQVLYLGADGGLDDQLPQPPSAPPRGHIDQLQQKLARLIDANAESMDLAKLMKLSLSLEPDLPEAYLVAKSESRRASVASGESMVVPEADQPANRVPLFNNPYLKVNLAKYAPEPPAAELAFVPSLSSAGKRLAGAEVDEDDDVPGLGIDVDDILTDRWPSHPSSEPPEDDSPKQVPRVGSIDKLIDLLLIDARHFEPGVHIDLTEYRFVFLLNYNSFITTKELLDKLAFRFINSGNAVISIMKQMSPSYSVAPGEFPNWSLDTSVDLKELGSVDYELLLKIQINILKVLIVLINNFYGNFSVDLINKSILIKLLKLFSNEILQWYNSNKIVSQNLEKSFENLVNYYKKLKKLFVKKSYRPVEISKFDEYLVQEFKFSNSLHEVPINRNLPGHKNVAKIDKFLLKFNKLLTVFYRGITTDDWVRVYKVLESLYEHNQLLEFNLQKSSTPDEYLVVSNVFHYFESLVDSDKSLILKKFPLVFRKLFKLYFKFKSYLLIQLTDVAISPDERLDRMKTLLIMVKISQTKMARDRFAYEGHVPGALVPSCIETAVTNVIYSPESRAFGGYWLRAAASFHEESFTVPAFDDLASLLPPSVSVDDLAPDGLLPCFGWVIENLLEITKVPSFVRGSPVVNFGKRYLVFRMLKAFEVDDGGDDEPSADDTREFDFLLKLDEALVAQNTSAMADTREPYIKESKRLFRSILREQHRILLIDYKKKQLREQVHAFPGSLATPAGQYVTSIASSNNILTKKTSSNTLRRQSLSYKSNSSSRFKISGLFGKSRSSGQAPASPQPPAASERVITERELPHQPEIDPKQKPSYVIVLRNRKVFPVYLMPLCFKIDGDGDDFFFQARSESDLNDWLVKLGFSARHWFFSRTLNARVPPTTTFGIPLAVVAARDQRLVPKLVVELLELIEREGMADVGIYRISCSLSELTALKAAIDTQGSLPVRDESQGAYDAHALTSVVKSLLRELPDALLTDKVIEELFSVKRDDANGKADENGDAESAVSAAATAVTASSANPAALSADEIDQFKEVLKHLPTPNYHTLCFLLQHLARIAANSATNKMTPSNLATVIGPALTEASSLDSLVNQFGAMNQVLEKLIVHSQVLFDPEFSQLRKQSIMVGGTIATTTGTPVTPSYPSTIIGTPVLNHAPLEKIDDNGEYEDDTASVTSADEAVPHPHHGHQPAEGASEHEGVVSGDSSRPPVDASGLPTPTIDDDHEK